MYLPPGVTVTIHLRTSIVYIEVLKEYDLHFEIKLIEKCDKC